MKPRVSVIVPLFNGAWCIAEAIESVRAQSLADFEAIIVDDGSTDDGHAEAVAAAGRDARFKVVRQTNAGLAGARNTGLETARGEFIAFLDADDRLMPDALAQLVDTAESAGTAGAFGRIEHRGLEMHPTGWAPMTTTPLVDHRVLLGACVFPVHAQVVRRDAIGSVRFDSRVRIGEDWDFWLRVSEQGAVWTAVDRVVGVYRMSPNSLSRRPAEMLESLRAHLEAAHERARLSGADRGLAIGGLALEWSTAMAITAPDESAPQWAAALAGSPTASITPEIAAARAFHRVPWQHAQTPAAWRSTPSGWLKRLWRFWTDLEAAQVASAGFSENALRALANLSADPALVARGCLTAASGGAGTPPHVHLLGLGNNARWLAEACVRSGVHFTGWDDRVAEGWRPAWERAVTGDAVPLRPATPDAPTIITPTDDSGLLRRTGPCVRWRQVHAELAQTALTRFRSAIGLGDVTAKGRPPSHVVPWA